MMATEWSKYYQAYARHNDLYKHITFNTSVTAVSKTADGKQWVLSFDQGSEPRAFDKLVWATGGENRVLLGSIPGAERFGERLLHSQQYKGYGLSLGRAGIPYIVSPEANRNVGPKTFVSRRSSLLDSVTPPSISLR